MSAIVLRKAAFAFALPMAIAVASGSAIAAEEIEEVVVTGSFIRGTPQDAALPVDLISQEDLIDNGSPTITEMIRNLNISNGNLGETNQFNGSGGQGNEGVATINLRGLGPQRSLVLINGRRHVSTANIGVDISAIPSIAIGRLEVLKDGAAALYGSDAIAGVANFITRENFRGFEVRGGAQTFEESDGEYNFGVIGGGEWGRVSAIAAFEYEYRSEVQLRDLDDRVRPFADNPQGGYSAIGNPGTLTPTPGFGDLFADPECANFGNTPAGLCRFQFTQFDNLVEEQDTYKAYAEVNVDLTDNVSWHTEALYSYMDIPEWDTSPSYPPQALFGPDRLVTIADHPGLQDFVNTYPDLLPAGTDAVYPIQRHAGAGGFGPDGSPRSAVRQTDTYRLSTALDGTLFDGELGFDIALSWSKRERFNGGVDMFVENIALALDGLGGPNCDAATGTPGQGDCFFYTPTSNGLARSAINGYVNPNANPDLVAANAIIQPWLEAELGTESTYELMVFDATFDGVLPIELAGGQVGYAIGLQARDETFDLTPDALNDLTVSPCPFNNPVSVALGNTDTLDCTQSTLTSPTGPFAFLAGTLPQSTDRTVYGAFLELGLPISERLNAQLAVRYEDYGGQVGNTIDPKLAVRFQATDSIALRGSVSTTFRGPPQNYLEGRGTSLNFIGATGAFKAVDTVGNPRLGQEEAVATNFGIIFDRDGFFGSLDFWRFDFTDPIQVENFNGIVNQYIGLGCQVGGAGEGTPDCNSLSDRLTFQSSSTTRSAAALQRIDVRFVNGGDITTQGIDWFGQYDFETDLGMWSVGTQGTYTDEYDVDDFLTEEGVFLSAGGDFVGNLNDNRNTITPIVDLQANAFLKFSRANHRATLTARYWGEYEDEGAVASLQDIDDMLTVDLNYNVSILDDRATLNLTVFNLLDEEPPLTQTDLNYDPYTHSPFGRMIKFGVIFSI